MQQRIHAQTHTHTHKHTHTHTHKHTQAATTASAADQNNAAPHEGDGYLYEHLEDKDHLWLDFIADTGDGG
jgi:hypothetical protein